jgi:hypothetical protein
MVRKRNPACAFGTRKKWLLRQREKKDLPGFGPTNENTLKNSLNSCQIFILLKLPTNISDCVDTKQF